MLCKNEVLQHLKDARLLSDKQHMLVPNRVQHLGKVLAGLPSKEATSFKLLYCSARES